MKVKSRDIPEELLDFRNFVYLIWEHIGLPEPTPVQYDISEFLQEGPRRKVIQAFRGVGKSFLTSAYVVWRLLLDPALNILVVSASKIRADDFSTFAQRIIWEMDIVKHLKPREEQRHSKIAFDVGPAQAAHAPSVKSVGITGQLTGSRADLIVADDVESLNNSATQQMRDKLGELIKEFEAILKPGGEITFLGTPQSEMSIYNDMRQRGYTTRIWPARFPENKLLVSYDGAIAPYISEKLLEEPTIINEPVDPLRFSEFELTEREASYGRSGFQLQFMLDTSLSDLDRYPLKLSDLIVTDIDTNEAPQKIIHSTDPERVIKDLPNVGFAGDSYYRPASISEDYHKFTGSVLAIDPSGRGQDETAYAVVKMLNGYLFVSDCGGLPGGYDEETLTRIAELARNHSVNLLLIESNFGDGMFNSLLAPYLKKIYPVSMEEVRHNTQKEKRIIDTLEPVMNQHKLVVSPSLIRKDYETNLDLTSIKSLQYQLFYQLSRVTKQRGSLAHDDRLDVLAMAVRYWVEQMGQDPDSQIKRRKDLALDSELKKFMSGTVIGKDKDSRFPNWIYSLA